MHKQTDQVERPMRAGHGEKLASRLGSGGNVRAGVSPAASTHYGAIEYVERESQDGLIELVKFYQPLPPNP